MSDKLSTTIRRVLARNLVTLTKDQNAHFMSPATFARLVANIRADGRLTSVPLVVEQPDGSLLVVSGNHRVRAVIEALGDPEIDVMVAAAEHADEVLDRRRVLALQLAHNAVIGEDDTDHLRELYGEIDDVDWRAYSGLDDVSLGLLEPVDVPTLKEANLDFATVTIAFLPDQLEQARQAIDDALVVSSAADERWLASMAQHGRMLDALDVVHATHNTRNIAEALQVILDVFEDHLDELDDGYVGPLGEPKHLGWVPLTAVFGTDRVPAPVAALLRRAADWLTERGEISTNAPWQALEYVFADFTAGIDNGTATGTD